MHAIVLAIILFLSNGSVVSHVVMHDAGLGSNAQALAECKIVGDNIRHETVGKTDKDGVSITDVEYTCGVVDEAKPV